MFLEAAVIVLALLWAGTLAFVLRYVRQQRELALQQAERDAVRDRRILELVKRVDHFQQSAVRVGMRCMNCVRFLRRCRTGWCSWSSVIRRTCRLPRRPSWLAWGRRWMS